MGKHTQSKTCSQQPLVGLFLVGLVGDVGEVDPTQGWTVGEHDVTHVKTQYVLLQPVLQVLQESKRKREIQRERERGGKI